LVFLINLLTDLRLDLVRWPHHFQRKARYSQYPQGYHLSCSHGFLESSPAFLYLVSAVALFASAPLSILSIVTAVIEMAVTAALMLARSSHYCLMYRSYLLC